MKPNRRWIIGTGLLAATFWTGVASGQARERSDRAADGVGVARISTVNGDVAKRHGGNGDLVTADSGAPLVSGDSVLTKAGARAEIRLDRSNFLRLGSNSEVRLRQLGEKYFRIEVLAGDVGYTMLKYGRAEATLHTPNVDYVLVKDGVYRVRVDGPKSSQVQVRKGEAEALTPEKSVVVHSGRSLRVEELDKSTHTAQANLGNRDAFDEWAKRRDQMLSAGQGGYGGWYPRTVIGVGYGYPFYDPWWGFYGGYYGGYRHYSRPVVVVRHRR